MGQVITNVNVYGLEQSIVASGYPMQTENVMHEPDNKDFNRAKRLGTVATGSGHDQFLTGIIAQFDLTFSNKAWVEAERYHFFDFVSSQSTMHRITKFDLDKSYNKYVDQRVIDVVKEYVDAYNAESDSMKKRELYLKVLYNNPAGFLLTARMTTNYRQLKTIWQQRKDHTLPEWRQFCADITMLPKFSELCIGG